MFRGGRDGIFFFFFEIFISTWILALQDRLEHVKGERWLGGFALAATSSDHVDKHEIAPLAEILTRQLSSPGI